MRCSCALLLVCPSPSNLPSLHSAIAVWRRHSHCLLLWTVETDTIHSFQPQLSVQTIARSEAKPSSIKGSVDKPHHHIDCINPLTIIMRVIAAALALCCLIASTYGDGKFAAPIDRFSHSLLFFSVSHRRNSFTVARSYLRSVFQC